MSTEVAGSKKLQIAVNYNGIVESFDYQPTQSVNAVRQHVLNHFGIKGDERERTALYQPDNATELPDGTSMEGAGVQPGTTLILRPRTAGGVSGA